LLIVFDSFCMVESEEETEKQNKTRLRNWKFFPTAKEPLL
jgi:hypothetical protein